MEIKIFTKHLLFQYKTKTPSNSAYSSKTNKNTTKRKVQLKIRMKQK